MVAKVFYNLISNPRTEILVVLLESVEFLPNQTAFAHMKWYFWHSSDCRYNPSNLQSHSRRHIIKSFKTEKLFILTKNTVVKILS